MWNIMFNPVWPMFNPFEAAGATYGRKWWFWAENDDFGAKKHFCGIITAYIYVGNDHFQRLLNVLVKVCPETSLADKTPPLYKRACFFLRASLFKIGAFRMYRQYHSTRDLSIWFTWNFFTFSYLIDNLKNAMVFREGCQDQMLPKFRHCLN